MNNADFLVEIGTEELPPKALRSLMDSFADALAELVDSAGLEHGDVHAYASPRRLAVLIESLARSQPDRKVEQKGPPVSIAFDDAGKPKPAALAFAKKCGVDVAELGRQRTDKGEWLAYEMLEQGQDAAVLMPGLVEQALAALPIPRRMRWGAGEAEFVRPVHWVVMLLGDQLIEADVLGVRTGKESRGHRFHSSAPVSIDSPADYLRALEEGHVIADFARRRKIVETAVGETAAQAGGAIVDGESLYDEVAALVEWPVPVLGTFDEKFLELPREAVISTLTGHQRYFPVTDAHGRLLPLFITVANLASKDPAKVREGNERVVLPRLADAAFFWQSDRNKPLVSRMGALRDVVYQQGLGSLFDKSARVAALAERIALELGHSPSDVERAALLGKCDLLTGMVGEFPELQGLMGRYYAAADGEPDAVATAIGDQYRPGFAGDRLPATLDGQILAVADKLDTISGIFALGKKPSGNRDPFALRRAALGVVRIVIECSLDFDVRKAIAMAVDLQPVAGKDAAGLTALIYEFLTDRLQRYFMDRDPALATETFNAVLARTPVSLVDFAARLAAVQEFLQLDAASSLAAANKRIANILKKTDVGESAGVSSKLLVDNAEKDLHGALDEAGAVVRPLLEQRDYTNALKSLAQLRGPVDRFFDEVMVMADDEKLRRNRLALLHELRALFLGVADISQLAVG